MRIRRGLLGLLGLPLLALPAAAAPPRKAVAHHDWSRTFSVTAGGGFLIGNPDAKIAVLEYGSLTCPHCRHFAETAYKPLVSQYVRTGKASYEFRSLVLNGIDVVATLVARCGGPSHFFPVAEQLYATQRSWIAKISDADADKLNALPKEQAMLGIAKATGLIPIAAAHGIPAVRAEACLKSETAADELAKMAQTASDAGVTGTPTFFVNGKQVPAYDWATLKPFLKDAGG